MKCFKHIDKDAVGTGEVYVGRTGQGDTYNIMPLCQGCFDTVVAREEHQKMMKENQVKGFMILLGIFAVGAMIFKYII